MRRLMFLAVALLVGLDGVGSVGANVRAASWVHALWVSGSTVAYTEDGCGELKVWSLTERRVTPITADVIDCGSGWYGDMAVTTAGEVVWVTGEEHNSEYGAVFVARASRPGAARQLYDAADEDLPVALAADGTLVAFSTEPRSGEGGRTTLWVTDRHKTTRRTPAGYHDPSLGVVPIRQVTGWMDGVAVEGDLVAARYRNGRVEVFRATGEPVRFFPAGTATNDAGLDGGQLVTLTEREVSVRSVATGQTLLSRPLRRPGEQVALLDARGGLVAYRADQEVRLLRTSDGRDVRVPGTKAPKTRSKTVGETVYARFATSGLVVSHGRVIELRPTKALHQLLATAG